MKTKQFGRRDDRRTGAAKLLDNSIRSLRASWSPAPRAWLGSSKNRRCVVRVGVLIGAVAVILVFVPLADAATCLRSPAEVRKLYPKAWPRWTRRPQGKLCWVAGTKPVAAKVKPRTKPARQVKAERVWDLQNGDPVWQTWSMEYRWHDSLASAKPAAPPSTPQDDAIAAGRSDASAQRLGGLPGLRR
jgi:hypothetical protein